MHRLLRRNALPAVALCLLVFTPGCLVRRRVAQSAAKHPNRPLITATKDDLIARIHTFFDPIHSFTMKVDMAPSVGNLYAGQVTDYASITGYILFLRPDDIRVIGQDPVIHSTAFDMVSVGNDFRVSIPSKSSFVEGQNSTPATSKNKLENLRPAAFLVSLIVRPPDPDEYTLLEDDTNESKAVYILHFIRRAGDQLQLVRSVYFDRYTLQIIRQKTFDTTGAIASDTDYSGWKSFGIPFPSLIDIHRPQDGYELQLSITDMKVNVPEMTPQKFVLNPPPNAKVRVLQ